MDRQQDTSGDYGYDLAHEEGRRAGVPADPAGRAERQPLPTDGRADADGDIGYDEAHDFRGS